MRTVHVTTTVDHILAEAVRLATPRAGEDRFQAQARTLDELGYTVVGNAASTNDNGSLQLVRHWCTAWDNGSDDAAKRCLEHAVGHPPIPTNPAVLDRLRARVQDRATPTGEPVGWHHRSGNAWVAVTDLHHAGEHDLAGALARLLHWCDRWPWDPGDGGARMWQLIPTGDGQ